MGNRNEKTLQAIVLGRKEVGKTYFIDKISIGERFFAGNIDFTYEMTVQVNNDTLILFKEYSKSKSSTEIKQLCKWDIILFIVKASATKRELMLSKNILLDYYSARPGTPVCIVHHVFPNEKIVVDFDNRKKLLQAEGLDKVVSFELDYHSTGSEWKNKLNQALTYASANVE